MGPRQYRLRAYPVLAPDADFGDPSSMATFGEPLHLWLRLEVPVRVLEDGELAWPLPDVAEVANLYWDEDTERRLDGQVFAQVDAWLPPATAATRASPPGAHTVQVGDVLVRARPLTHTAPTLPEGQRIGVLVDGSRSMEANRSALGEALDWIAAEVAPRNHLTLLCTRQQGLRDCAGLDAASYRFWGATPLEHQLLAVDATGLDSLVVLTDRGSPELAPDGLDPFELPALWLVHLDGLPVAYTDALLDTLTRTGGGVGTDVAEVFGRLDGSGGLADGWAWSTEPATEQTAAVTTFAPLAARQAVAALARAQVDISPESLDRIHAVAVQHSIVTPWSSMIVLVNDRQQEALKEASQQEDRFDREVERGGADPATELFATPEPGEWLLMGLALVGLVLLRRDELLRARLAGALSSKL